MHTYDSDSTTKLKGCLVIYDLPTPFPENDIINPSAYIIQ